MPRLSTTAAVALDERPPPSLDGVQLPLLTAKLESPALAHPTVARPRLLTLLSRGVRGRPLTLLSGPAGSGKTVLAASWLKAQTSARSIAWLTLDDYDDEPAVFWGYVVKALTGAGVVLGDVPQLVPGEPRPIGFLTSLAAAITDRPQPVVLIIDNADHLTSDAIVSGLDLLVRNAGSRLRLVLCARADPQLPLHQYRLAGTMAEIRGSQLAFTAEETGELLAVLGVPVPADVAERLTVDTEGWAVGLRLAAAPLTQGVLAERLVTSLAQDDGSVAQYLFAEVLAGQTAEVRRLLLRTSVTAELHPDLVDRLVDRPNSRRSLAALARANAFVEASPGAPGGYRIHSLFREMLLAQLGYEEPGEMAALHGTCAAWYSEVGRAGEAIAHAIAADDWELASRLLVDDMVVARLLAHGLVPAVRVLPSEVPGTDAAVLRAAIALAAGASPSSADLALVDVAAGTAGPPELRVSAALVRLVAGAAGREESARVLALADEAQEVLGELPADARQRRESTAVLASVRSLAALGGSAPFQEVVQRLRVAAGSAHAAGTQRLRARAVALLALLEAVDGHLTRALEHAREAEAVFTAAGTEEQDRGVAAAAASAWVHLQRCSPVEARQWLARAETRERSAPACPEGALTGALLAELQSHSLRLRCEYDAAEDRLRPRLVEARLPGWVRDRLVLEAARLAVARGRPDHALRLVGEKGVDPVQGARVRALVALTTGDGHGAALLELHGSNPVEAVESRVLRACRLAAEGAARMAAHELEQALQLARPEALRLPFVEAPPGVRRMLRAFPQSGGPAGWLSPSSAALPGTGIGAGRPADQAPPGRLQDLSDRETEVLEHLADMLSTAEIAASMFISVNTVRTHIRSILRKLGVSRRNTAVRLARERGLL